MSVKVSICIPTYNNVDEVERLLRSIFVQTYTDFEVHISDDSTNREIEELVKRKYAQVDYRHNEKPYGHIFNWNEAIRMSRGEYIKIMFSDDWFTTEDSLASFVRMLEENPDANFAFSGSRQVNLESEARYDRHAEEQFLERLRRDYRLLFLGNQIGAPSAVMYRRGKSVALFDEQSNWASDMFLYFDILAKNPRFVCSTEPLISIGVHEHQYTESFSEKDERIYQDYRYMFEKYHLAQIKECRSFFLKKYMLPFGKGLSEAKKLHLPITEYGTAWLHEQVQTVKSFVLHRLGLV